MLHVVTSPLFVRTAKKETGKKYRINLNNFNKRKGYGYNNIKKAYCDQIAKQLVWLKIDWSLEISYQLIRYYKVGKGRKDKWNVLSAIQKFFLDSLVELWYLPDDNDEMIDKEIFPKPAYIQDKLKTADDSVVVITLTTKDDIRRV